MTLANLKKSQKGIINKFLDDQIASRLMSMGFLPGARVELIRYIPLKGAMYCKINGNNVALRKEEASLIGLNTI